MLVCATVLVGSSPSQSESSPSSPVAVGAAEDVAGVGSSSSQSEPPSSVCEAAADEAVDVTWLAGLHSGARFFASVSVAYNNRCIRVKHYGARRSTANRD